MRALVTGGSHGIGLAIKNHLSDEGILVESVSRREGVDVLDVLAIEAYLREKSKFDILVNNVGGGGRWGNENPLKTDPVVWNEVYQKNAGACRAFTMALLPYMLEQKWGRVITISSIYGKEGGGRPWFAMAKASEIALMKSLAIYYKDSGVTFNTVCPGMIAISGTGNETEGGSPSDVASLVTFLCSDKAKWINGTCIVVDNAESRSF